MVETEVFNRWPDDSLEVLDALDRTSTKLIVLGALEKLFLEIHG
jgi:hypothetical protein